VTVGVAEDLDLDVPRLLDIALQEHGVIAERPLGLAPGGFDRGHETLGLVHDPHTLPATTSRGLREQRVADLLGQRQQHRGIRR